MNIKRKNVTLVLTQNCNLRCTYCYEVFKSSSIMPIELAKQIVDEEMINADEYDEVCFDLFGGEPFLEFDTIRELVEYADKKGYLNKCIFFATSNGTLVHGEIQDWLRKYHNSMWVGLSLDGTKEMHDCNRSNSFDRIDLDFFASMYSRQEIKMTISKESLPNLYEGVVFCHEKGFLVSCNLAFNIDWSAKENIDILERELKKLIDYYLKNPQITPCSIIGSPIDGIVRDETKPLKRQCGAGVSMVAYDIDGKKYPCQFFMPSAMGENNKQVGEIDLPELTPDDLLDPKCKNCPVKAICIICYGANYASTGSTFLQNDNMCKLNKVIFKARSYYQGMRWKMGQLSDMPAEDLERLLMSVKIIQSKL